MSRSVLIYATLLLLSSGASWLHYTREQGAAPKEGVVLLDLKRDALQQIVYASPDLTVTFEIRKDDLGTYGWVTINEKRKKKVDGQETVEEVTTRFKAGATGDKLIEGWAPLMALRELGRVEDKIETFGLSKPDTTLTVQSSGRTSVLDLGGETYGTKDRYVRDQATGVVFVLDDEVIKNFKLAKSKLRDNLVTSPKKEEITAFEVTRAGATIAWEQRNIEDRAAAFWTRKGGDGSKDETFSNWLDKLLKIRSTDYVQPGAEPADLQPALTLRITPVGKPAETVEILTSGEDWYARGSYLRGLVKLNKTTSVDAVGEIDDVIEGKAPAEKPKEAGPATPGEPPLSPGGPPHGMPGMPPGMSPGPTRPGLPPGAVPKAP